MPNRDDEHAKLKPCFIAAGANATMSLVPAQKCESLGRLPLTVDLEETHDRFAASNV